MTIPSGIWKHHGGGFYQVLGVGQHTETGELVVVYVSLTGAHMPGPRLRVRPLEGPEGFTTEVWKITDDPDPGFGKYVARFEHVGNEIPPGTLLETH